jgi:hypothetical protein
MNPFDAPPSASPAIPAEKFQLVYWINELRTYPKIFLILLVAAGVIFLLYGRSTFRIIVILHAVLLAGLLGRQLGLAVGRPWLFTLGFAIVFGILAWPLLKFGIAVLCGLAGAALISQIALLFPRGPDFLPWTGVLGFILFAILGWSLIPIAVTIFTALEGATLILLPVLVLVEHLGMSFQKTAWLTFDRPGVLHAAILILALLGMLYQIGFAQTSIKDLPSEKTKKTSG